MITGQRIQQKCCVLDIAGHGPITRHLFGEAGGIGYQTGGRSHPDDITERGRVAQRTHEVTAISDRHKIQTERGSRATTTAPRTLRRVVWIQGRTKHTVVTVRTQPRLGDVGFTNKNSAGGPQPTDMLSIA